MDSCRWDMFHLADAPNMKNFTKMRMVYSRAGITPPSLFGVFMNLSWYESNGAVPVPELKRWVWVPRELQKRGYHTVLATSNPMLELYRNWFEAGFDEYVLLKGCTYHADKLAEIAIDNIHNHEKTYVFLLFMETHQPYPYKKSHTQEYYNTNYRPVTRQKRSIETIDKDFGHLVEQVAGTDTDILIFADHGDLDLKMEGIKDMVQQSSTPNCSRFHMVEKLFNHK